MDYGMEELLPLVQRLSEQYTCGESTSVTYERAESLMEAVIYCIELSARDAGGKYLPAGEKAGAAQAYQNGYAQVIEKTKKAKELFDLLMRHFQDYGCRNLQDTMVHGMPRFFLYYDAKFRPQDTLLTLDYPLMQDSAELTGVERICHYLSHMRIECGFLSHFSAGSVEKLLDELEEDGRQHFYGNICEEVLFRSLLCMLAGRRVDSLSLEPCDWQEIREVLKKEDKEQTEQRFLRMISWLVRDGMREEEDMELYLQKAAKGCAARLTSTL